MKEARFIIEAGRNEFQTSQTRLLDIRGTYQVSLGSIPSGWLLGALGYPKIDLKKFDPVLAADTKEIFETKVQAPVKF